MSTKISAIILAGGQGRRLNHRDKGLIDYHGEPLISHVVKRLQPQVDQIIINCNRHIESYKRLGFPVCQDTLSGFQGPLAGIQASLPLVTHPFCLICPCDTPNLPSDLVKRLLEVLQRKQYDVVYPATSDRLHFLPALISSGLSVSLDHYLNNKDRSVRGWYSQLRTSKLDFSSSNGSFLNINTPDSFVPLAGK